MWLINFLFSNIQSIFNYSLKVIFFSFCYIYLLGKITGSLLSSYEAETGLLWMWAGLSFFLSSGDGYVGELLELQQGCEGLFICSRGLV